MMLDAATELETLKVPPGNRLESLKGDRNGQHSIRINIKWRICFIWSDGNAFDVEIIDVVELLDGHEIVRNKRKTLTKSIYQNYNVKKWKNIFNKVIDIKN